MNNTKALQKELESVTFEDYNLDKDEKFQVPANLETWTDEDGTLHLSAETEFAQLFVDYYGEFRGGYPYISDKIRDIAKKHGFDLIEWDGPASISFYEG